MSKAIMLLVATQTNNPAKIKILLANKHMMPIDGDLLAEEPIISADTKEIIEDARVRSVVWRWPSGNAFRDVNVEGQLILGILAERGVGVSLATPYSNKQVPDAPVEGENWTDRANHLELILEVSDAKFAAISAKYGALAEV